MLAWLAKLLRWRPGIVYAYSTLDHFTGKRIYWSYVGKTRQQLEVRHSQHMGYDSRQTRQPWSDLYPDIRIVFYFRYCPDWLLDCAEKWTIKLMKPRYNYIHNTKNTRRIPKYDAEAQRVERDRLRRTRRVW